MRHIFTSILISAIVTSGGLWLYDHNFATKVATIDLSAYVTQLKQDYVDGRMDKDAINSKIRDLGDTLKNEYKNTVVLLKEVVVSGRVKDIYPGK